MNEHLATPTRIEHASISVQPERYVTIKLFAAIRGLTPEAVEKRIERGVFVENAEFKRGPDGRIWMDNKGFDKWVEGRRGR